MKIVTDLSVSGLRASALLNYLPPGGSPVPELIADFASGIHAMKDSWQPFAGLVAFTRASTGTYWDADGVLQTAAVDEARFDHDPATGQALGLRIEESVTNSLLHSTDVSNAAWSGQADFIVTGALSAISGATAQRLENRGTATFRFVHQFTPAFDGEAVTASIIWEEGTATTCVLGIRDESASTWVIFARLDAETAAAAIEDGSGTTDVQALGIGPNGGRMFRLSISGTGNAGNASGVWLYPTGTTLNTDSAFVHHVQHETGTSPSSPILTEGSAVTRAGDVAVLPSQIAAALGIEQDGTVLAVGREPRSTFTDGMAVAIAIRPTAERIVASVRDFAGDGTLRPYFQQFVGGDNDQSTNTLPPVSPSRVKLALAWDAASVSGVHDGTIVWTPTKSATRINQVQTIDIGAFPGGSRKWGGTIERLVIWPSRLSDAQLQGITA